MDTLIRTASASATALISGIATIAVIFFSGIAAAAEFRIAQNNSNPGVPILVISGEIKRGDTDALIRYLRSQPELGLEITDVWLNSPGGDLKEAIGLGDLLETLGYSAMVPKGGTCASACFFVWVSATGRLAPGQLIIHRPYFAIEENAASASAYERAFREAGELARRHLSERNVPSYLIEVMLTVSSTDGYTLTTDDKARIGVMSAARIEYMIQNCGLNDAYRASEARGAATLTIEALQSLRECGLSFYRQQREQFFAEAGSALTPEAK